MAGTITTTSATVAGQTQTVWTLAVADARAEVWPGIGGNVLRWHCAGHDRLYVAPDFASNPVPTRSGNPILFPFPNRIRAGQFSHAGRTYPLPKNDSTHANAIHGFAPRHPWTVHGHRTDAHSATLHLAFAPRQHAPAVVDLWPSAYECELRVRLSATWLGLDFSVRNCGAAALPFGLGYHPYFIWPGAANIDECWLETPAEERWELVEQLPTGQRLPLTGAHDFRTPRALAGVVLDDVLTSLPIGLSSQCVARMGHCTQPGELQVWADPAFRELVVFTPPHRRALCLEPYTCPTDAANLAAQGLDVGWQLLPAGASWSGQVDYRWVS